MNFQVIFFTNSCIDSAISMSSKSMNYLYVLLKSTIIFSLAKFSASTSFLIREQCCFVFNDFLTGAGGLKDGKQTSVGFPVNRFELLEKNSCFTFLPEHFSLLAVFVSPLK